MISFDLEDYPRILLIGRRICGLTWEHSLSTVQHHEYVVIAEGNLLMKINGEDHRGEAGDCILLAPGDRFYAKTDGCHPTRYYIIHFHINNPVREIGRKEAADQVKQMLSRFNYENLTDIFDMPQIQFKTIFLMRRCTLASEKETVFELLEAALKERNHLVLNSSMMISSYLSILLVLLSRRTLQVLDASLPFPQDDHMPRAVQEALFYIHDHYSKPISLSDLCEEIRVSPQYLIRAFRQSLSKTPVQYINWFRISQAKYLLKNTLHPVNEIACEVGIENPYYFSRLFKKITRFTPTQYRQS